MNTLLFQRFRFQKPIELQHLEKGDEIISLPDKTIIRMDAEAEEKDLAPILAKAKLAEQDQLLGTFFFQKNLTEEESKLAHKFFNLCQPLQDAWTYKVLRQYAPDIYEAEIEELIGYWKALQMMPPEGGIAHLTANDPKMRNQVLSMFAILNENPANTVEMLLITDKENSADWDGYISALKEFVHAEPDANLYLRLATASNAPYTVQIITEPDGFRHFEVKKR